MRNRWLPGPGLFLTLMALTALVAASSAWGYEIQLAGIRLGQHSLHVLQTYGQPDAVVMGAEGLGATVYPVAIRGAQTAAGGGAGAGGPGAGAPGAGPAGGPGGPGPAAAGAGGGMGAGAAPPAGGAVRPGGGGGPGAFAGPGGGPMGGGVGPATGMGGGRGGPGGMPGPGGEMAGAAPGGPGGPGAAGMAGGPPGAMGAGPSRPGAAGGAAGGRGATRYATEYFLNLPASLNVPMQQNEQMWVYQRKGVHLAFILDRDGYVVGILVAGKKCDWARTALWQPKRTIKLGDDFQKVIQRYGYPHTTSGVEGDGFSRDVVLHYGYNNNIQFLLHEMKVVRIFIWEADIRPTAPVRAPAADLGARGQPGEPVAGVPAAPSAPSGFRH